jgi:hypothetical protein
MMGLVRNFLVVLHPNSLNLNSETKSWSVLEGMATTLRPGPPGVRILLEASNCIFSKASKPALRPTHTPSPIQRVPGLLPCGKAAEA